MLSAQEFEFWGGHIDVGRHKRLKNNLGLRQKSNTHQKDLGVSSQVRLCWLLIREFHSHRWNLKSIACRFMAVEAVTCLPRKRPSPLFFFVGVGPHLCYTHSVQLNYNPIMAKEIFIGVPRDLFIVTNKDHNIFNYYKQQYLTCCVNIECYVVYSKYYAQINILQWYFIYIMMDWKRYQLQHLTISRPCGVKYLLWFPSDRSDGWNGIRFMMSKANNLTD